MADEITITFLMLEDSHSKRGNLVGGIATGFLAIVGLGVTPLANFTEDIKIHICASHCTK